MTMNLLLMQYESQEVNLRLPEASRGAFVAFEQGICDAFQPGERLLEMGSFHPSMYFGRSLTFIVAE